MELFEIFFFFIPVHRDNCKYKSMKISRCTYIFNILSLRERFHQFLNRKIIIRVFLLLLLLNFLTRIIFSISELGAAFKSRQLKCKNVRAEKGSCADYRNVDVHDRRTMNNDYWERVISWLSWLGWKKNVTLPFCTRASGWRKRKRHARNHFLFSFEFSFLFILNWPLTSVYKFPFRIVPIDRRFGNFYHFEIWNVEMREISFF